MALKIVLKPGERIIVSGAVITNGKTAAQLLVENQVPILRQKDIMRGSEATTPCRQIYLVIQLMYIDAGNLAMHHHTYWNLVQDVLTDRSVQVDGRWCTRRTKGPDCKGCAHPV